MATTIYGASDDLIEIEGDIREEFSAPAWGDNEGRFLVAASDGTLIEVRYEGIWRITVIHQGSGIWTHDPNPLCDDERYSDRLTCETVLAWVALATDYAAPRRVIDAAMRAEMEGEETDE